MWEPGRDWAGRRFEKLESRHPRKVRGGWPAKSAVVESGLPGHRMDLALPISRLAAGLPSRVATCTFISTRNSTRRPRVTLGLGCGTVKTGLFSLATDRSGDGGRSSPRRRRLRGCQTWLRQPRGENCVGGPLGHWRASVGDRKAGRWDTAAYREEPQAKISSKLQSDRRVDFRRSVACLPAC